ncbi:MAG: glycosyltransferase family 4 protein [bacterium]
MKKTKVLYVFCAQSFSGAEIVIERLISHNPDIEPIALCAPGPFSERLAKLNIQIIEDSALLSLEREKNKYGTWDVLKKVFLKIKNITKRLINIIKKEKINIIHSNNIAASFYCIPAIIISKITFQKQKWIWSNQDLEYPNHKSFKLLAIFCSLLFNKTIAASKAVKDKYCFFSKKTIVIYAGLSTQTFQFNPSYRNEFRAKYKLEKQKIAIGIIGVISEGKGHHILISAFKDLLSRHNNIVLIIIGRFSSAEAEYKRKILNSLDTIPTPNRILISHIDHIHKTYSGIDILVNCSIPSRSEPLGTTIYEAMSCERIAIASDTGGSKEIITDNEDGFLFKAGCKKDLEQKLSHIITNINEFSLLRQKARKKVIENFNINSMIRNYNFLISKL